MNQLTLAELVLEHVPLHLAMYTVTGPCACVHCDHLAVMDVPADTFALSWCADAVPALLQWNVGADTLKIGSYVAASSAR